MPAPKRKYVFDEFMKSVERDSEAETLAAYRDHFRRALAVMSLRKTNMNQHRFDKVDGAP